MIRMTACQTLGMKKVGLLVCLPLVAFACGGGSDSEELAALRVENEMLKSQTTTTAAPTTTVAPTTTAAPVPSDVTPC